MRKFITLLFATIVAGFGITGCERPSNPNGSGALISISVPNLSGAALASARLASSSKDSSNNGSFGLSMPTNFSSLNCYYIFVGGPETAMSNNSCNLQSGKTYSFGLLAGPIAAGSTASFQVSAGSNRSIYMGGYMTDSTLTSCPSLTNMQSVQSHISPPVFLGSVNGLNLTPDTSVNVSVPVTASLLASNQIQNCSGAITGGNNSGPGNGSGPGNSGSLTYTYSNPTYHLGVAITSNSPVLNGTTFSSYSVSPSLPTGLSLNTSTGVITGTPTSSQSATTYTISASTGSGSYTGNVTITISNALLGIFNGAVGYSSSSSGTCPNGGTTSSWCSAGLFTTSSTDGGFKDPQSIAIDSTNGFIYAADTGNFRIVKLALSTGAFVGAIGFSTTSTGTCPSGAVTPGWCTGGTFVSNAGDGGFTGPTALAVDPSRNSLYVIENGAYRVMKFTLSTGAFVGAIGKTTSSTGTCPATGAAASWCTGGIFTNGNGDGIFDWVTDLVVDTSTGYLYVSDLNNGKISKISSTGSFLGGIGYVTTAGSAPCATNYTNNNGWCLGAGFGNGSGGGVSIGYFGGHTYLAIDSSGGFLYAADPDNYRIAKINLSTGIVSGANGYIGTVGASCTNSGVNNSWCTDGTFTAVTVDGGYNANMSKIAYDPTFNLLYVISGNGIQQINASTGQVKSGSIGAIATLGSASCAGLGGSVGSAAPSFCLGATFQTGSADGAFFTAKGLAIDSATGYLYVSDQYNRRIQRFQ